MMTATSPHPVTQEVDPEALVQRAAALRPRLRELQEEHERRGGYGTEVHAAFQKTGLYRVLHPRRFGGLHQDLETFLRVGIEISRGDPAVGWSWVLCGAHVFHVASNFPERAQIELLDGRDLIAPAPVRPTGFAVPIDEGFRLSGTWAYCSGSTWSTDILVAAMIDDPDALPGPSGPAIRVFAVPRADYEILDDWGGDATLGMGASGSNSVRVSDAIVPEYRTIPMDLLLNGAGDRADSPGLALHGDPLYLGKTAAVFTAELTASQVGAAWAALDEYEDLMRTRTTPFPPIVDWIDSDEHHRRYGAIVSLVSAAEELLRGVGRRHAELGRAWVERGEPFTAAEDMRLRGIVLQAARLAAEAVDLAVTTAGTSATRRGSRLAKYHRDVTTMRTHYLLQADTAATAISRAQLLATD